MSHLPKKNGSSANQNHRQNKKSRIAELSLLFSEETEKRERTEKILRTIFDIAANVNQVANLDELYHSIHKSLANVIDVTNFFIALYDKEKDALTFPYFVDEMDLIEDYGQYNIEHISQSNMLSAEVIKTEKPLLIYKKEVIEYYLAKGKKFPGTPAEVWLGVPLRIKNEIIGIICTQSYHDPHHFTEKDIEIMVSVSDHVAIAIDRKRADENARIRSERLTVINQIGSTVAKAHDLEELMEAVYEEISRIFSPDCFFIGFIDQVKNEMELLFMVEDGKRKQGVKFSIGQGLSSKVVKEMKPLIILDYEKERLSLPKSVRWGDPPFPHSWVGVPLMYDSQVIGVISVQSYAPQAWNEEDLQLFFTIADQITATIQKARLFNKAHKRAEHLTVINRIGKVAATADNLDQLIETIYDEINLVFRPNEFFIAFFDKKTDELEFRFHINNIKGKQPNMRRPIGDGLCSKVIKKRTPLIIRNYEEEKQTLPKQIQIGDIEAALSWIGIPLMYEDQVIGVVTMQAYKPYAWNDEDIQLFFTITDQIAGNIVKARLFEEARMRLERLAVLNRIGQLAGSALSLDQLLSSIYEEIRIIFKPSVFFIAFHLKQTEELEFRYLMMSEDKQEVRIIPVGNGLSAKVIAENKPLIVNHYDQECETRGLPHQILLCHRGPAQSWIGVPLIFEGELIGIANIQSFTPNIWNPEDQQLFFTIVDQIGAVIQKTRLYEAVQQELNERKKAEEEKRLLEMQLRQAQKMEAIGTLAGGIAHDFNNVLFPIIGFSEMTMDLIPEESLARKNLEQILTAANRAKDLIHQILTFSRQQEYNPQSLRIQSIIKEALKLIRSSMPATISIIQKIDETCGPTMADPTQIHQIIMNLCTNAYHAMRKQGGVLEVGLREVEMRPGTMDRPVRLCPGLYLCLTIKDTGHGIDPLVMQKIFDPYFTTKPQGEGTGLGLAVVHGIVKSYDGEIMVTSQPGLGAAFQIFLPKVMDNKQDPLIVMPECIPGRGERILFVDDEEHIVSMIQQMLQSLNYKVVTKTNSLEALEEFSMNPNLFDLVITDQTMPGLTGFDLAKKMLAIRPGIAIILCTGYSELVNEKQALAIGIRRFILKPLLKSQLSILIREVLDKENVL